MANKIVSIDIDGTLTEYPKPWLNFLGAQEGRRFYSVDLARKELGFERYNFYKHLWRISAEKYSVPIRKEMKDVVEFIYSRHGKVHFNTCRPFERYPKMHDLTRDWLERSGIRFESVNRKSVKNLEDQGAYFHIDDQITEVHRLSSVRNLKHLILLESDGRISEDVRIIKNKEVQFSKVDDILTLMQNYFLEQERNQ